MISSAIRTGRPRARGWRPRPWPAASAGRGWLPEYPRQYQAQTCRSCAAATVVEMMQVPGLDAWFPPQTVVCRQITDKIVGLLAPWPGNGRHLRQHPSQGHAAGADRPAPGRQLLADLPDSRAEVAGRDRRAGASGSGATRERVPGQGRAGSKSPAARLRRFPLALGVAPANAAGLHPQRRRGGDRRAAAAGPQSRNSGKQEIIIWDFTERDLDLGTAGWQSVALPEKM